MRLTSSVALRKAALASENRTGSIRELQRMWLVPNMGWLMVRATGMLMKRLAVPGPNCRRKSSEVFRLMVPPVSLTFWVSDRRPLAWRWLLATKL